jgi:hypothetical protein
MINPAAGAALRSSKDAAKHCWLLISAACKSYDRSLDRKWPFSTDGGLIHLFILLSFLVTKHLQRHKHRVQASAAIVHNVASSCVASAAVCCRAVTCCAQTQNMHCCSNMQYESEAGYSLSVAAPV